MYVSLHNRSAYSFGSALTMPEALAGAAAEMDMPAIGLTDHAGLYAAVIFQQACEKADVKPIFGAEMPLRDGGTVTLLARNLAGYGNLCRLISLHHLRDDPIDVRDLCEHADGLICLIGSGLPDAAKLWERGGAGGGTGGKRGVGGGKDRGAPRAPQRVVKQLPDVVFAATLREAFAGRLYIELAIHGPDDVIVARDRARFADEHGIDVVAVCESRCLRRDPVQTLNALASIGTLTLLDQPHPDKPTGAWHLRTPEEMAHLFARRPDALANTLRIAGQCNCRLDLSQSRFPGFESPDGRGAMAHLRELAYAGCRRRYVEQPQQLGIGGKRPTLAEAIERIDRELAIIDTVHYAEYFLVFHEIVEYCRSRGISSLARGSAADSLVCYVLGISHACPFRFDLPFDRFVNPERAKFSKMADIDLDLPWDRRDEVIRWVYDRWGHDRVARVGSANTFHARATVAELGKAYGLPAHEIHQTTQRMPHVTAWNLHEAMARSPESRGLPIADEPYRTILRMARDFEGLPRHWAMHPCGLVVSPEPLTDLIPVQRSPRGMLIAQYEMDGIEDLGFVKVDLLGQAGLSVLRDSVAEIQRTEGRRVNLETDVDYSERDTWEMIATGNARGVHHIESPAMTNLIQQCNCRDIDCLTAIVAVIRPGASNQGKKDAFARRHRGVEQPTYPHPSVLSVLEKTYGLMVFEEHILQIAVEFAGMNLGRADVLRRALNKEKRALVLELKSEFYASALLKGRAPSEIDRVWPLLEGFSGFMFNKAHSAEYAVEAFQGAWLKRRWPAHYLAAILSNYRGFYAHSPTLPQILYVLEAMRLGATFLPPCVNRSRERFSVEYGDESMRRSCRAGFARQRAEPALRIPGLLWHRRPADETPGEAPMPQTPAPRRYASIRVPVSHIKGLSADFIDRHLAEREREPFNTLADFVQRCQPGEAEAVSLLDSGALDVFGDLRPGLFWQLRGLTRRVSVIGPTLWENARPTGGATPPIALTSPSPRQIAQREMELLGFPITIDPLTYLGSNDDGGGIDWTRYVPVARLGEHAGRRVSVCGLMVADRINRTTGGELMKFVTLADYTGCVETHLFPRAYQRFGHLTVANPILAATGVVEPFENNNGLTLRVESVAVPTTKEKT